MEKKPHKFWLMILVPKWWSVQGCCLYEYADVPYWDAWISTKSCKNRETCYLMQLYTNAICKTLSRKWQGCTFSVVCFSLVHWCLLIIFFFIFFFLCLLMRYIHKWLGDPQWITCWTCVRACSCYMLSGLLWYYYHYYYYYYTHMCVVNATICRGPWACVVCSVRCFCLLGNWRTTLGSWETENLKSWIVS